jgi:hypothetical protein
VQEHQRRSLATALVGKFEAINIRDDHSFSSRENRLLIIEN